MKFLVDMNLSPRWCATLQTEGWDCVHWSSVGSASASDQEIMQWARREQRIVLTHDLDFGAILAATQAIGPSVVQVRTQDIRPQTLASLLNPLLRQYEAQLLSGCLLTIDAASARVRLLPFSRS